MNRIKETENYNSRKTKNMENMLPMTVEFKDGFELDLPLPPAIAKVPVP